MGFPRGWSAWRARTWSRTSRATCAAASRRPNTRAARAASRARDASAIQGSTASTSRRPVSSASSMTCGPADLGQGPGVVHLVVAGGVRVGHEDGGAAERGQLGDGGGPGAAHDDVGGGVGVAHVLDEVDAAHPRAGGLGAGALPGGGGLAVQRRPGGVQDLQLVRAPTTGRGPRTMAWFSDRAPWEPPKTSRVGMSGIAARSVSRASARRASRSRASISSRTGLPVTTTLSGWAKRSAEPGKVTAMRSAQRPANRLARPGHGVLLVDDQRDARACGRRATPGS